MPVFKASVQQSLGQLYPNFIESSRVKQMQICLNGPGHMINMATMPILGKNLLPNQLTAGLEPGMCHWILKYYLDYTNDNLLLILTFLMAESSIIQSIWENARA